MRLPEVSGIVLLGFHKVRTADTFGHRFAKAVLVALQSNCRSGTSGAAWWGRSHRRTAVGIDHRRVRERSPLGRGCPRGPNGAAHRVGRERTSREVGSTIREMGSHRWNTSNASSTEVGSHLSSGVQRSLACDWDLVNLSSDFKKPEHSECENLFATKLSDLIYLIQSRNN